MKKILSLICLLGMCVGIAQAQTGKVTVSGTVWDADLNEAMEQATVQLLTVKDSSFVNGGMTKRGGAFQLPAVKPGSYLLKVSFIGYVSQFKPLKLAASKPKVNVGKIDLSADAVMMQEAVVIGHVPPVQMSEDTMAFNAAAYKVSEGSMLEELVKKLPGAEVDEDGKITINGKSISKILINGKEFFGDDQDMAMKNIPVEMIEKLKTYERQSDMARITGIDDGEEQTVLDLSVKKEMTHSWISNADLAGGTKSRYSAKGMVSRFSDVNRITLIGGLNNVNDRGISGRGRGNRGLFVRKDVGLDLNYENEKLEANGSVRFGYNSNDNQNKSNSETFLNEKSSFDNSFSQSLSSNNNFNARFKLEWKPDTLTNLLVRPSFSYGRSESGSNSFSATFDADPYVDGVSDPLEVIRNGSLADHTALADILINDNERKSSSNSKSNKADIEFQLFRRLSDNGRSITLRGSAGYSDSDGESMSWSRIQYYRDTQDEQGAREAINRYSLTPTENQNYSAQLAYNEPLFKGGFLQFRYNFQYKYSKSDRSTFNVLDQEWPSFPALPEGDVLEEDEDLSKFAEYTNYIHNVSLNFRWTTEKIRLSVGARFVPQESQMKYKYQGLDTAVVRHVSNWSPNMDFRYRWSKQTQLRLRYRGSTDQPSMTDLLDITDDSDPLNITKGNPGLKPSFKHNINGEFSTYNPTHQRNIMVRAEYSTTLNSISSKMTYNDETGVRTTQPENINGNWDASLVNAFNTAFKNQNFTFGNFLMGRYSNKVAFLAQDTETLKNTTTNLSVFDAVNFRYRSDWFDCGLNGSVRYSDVNNKLQENNSMNTYDFSYGGEATVRFPWNMELTTNINNSSRRGYNSESMNTDELIWNAQISQNFLKGNAATVMFQVFDILRNQSNISRNITATMRSDTEYNAINSYCMLHFIYRLNLFGGKNVRKGGPDGPDQGFRPGGRPGGYGRHSGGFGGPGRGRR